MSRQRSAAACAAGLAAEMNRAAAATTNLSAATRSVPAPTPLIPKGPPVASPEAQEAALEVRRDMEAGVTPFAQFARQAALLDEAQRYGI